MNNAFVNDVLQEEVYVEQPLGFGKNNSQQLVCRLKKAIYGLKQAPRDWFDKLKSTLVKMDYSSTKSDNSIITKFDINDTNIHTDIC